MRYIFTLFLAVVTCTTAYAQLTNGLIAHWDFSGNVNDISGNNLTGTPTQVTYTAGKLGNANTAGEFNGSGSHIEVPYNNLMNANAMSICAVVKLDDFYSGLCQTTMIMQRGTTTKPGSYCLNVTDQIDDNDCNAYDPTTMIFHQQTCDIEFNITPLSAMTHASKVQKNKWYVVVTTYDGFRTNVYIDGALAVTYTSNRTKGTSTEGLTIGAINIFNRSKFPDWLDGQLDDLRIYNRALTPTEVGDYNALFDTGIVIKDTTARSVCMGDTFHLAYTTVATFNAGNTFTAQLSDINGNFNSPVNLGSVTAGTSGNIVCTMPGSLVPGKGCKVRIISSSPVKISGTSKAVTIYDKQPPVVNIIATPAGLTQPGQSITYIATIVNSGMAHTIKWYRNGQWVANVTGDTLTINTLNHGDSIYAEITTDNPCMPQATQRSNAIYVWSNTDVGTLLLQNLRVFPNPGTGSFTLTANDISYKELAVTVYNATGQMVYSSIINPQQKLLNEHITLSDVANGIYLLRISADGKDRNIRLLISK